MYGVEVRKVHDHPTLYDVRVDGVLVGSNIPMDEAIKIIDGVGRYDSGGVR